MTLLGTGGPDKAWRGSDYPTARAWVRALTPQMRDEIILAAKQTAAAGLEIAALTPASFALPKTAPMLEKAVNELENGSGFVVLSGFPIDMLDRRETLRAFAGLGGYLGQPVAQNSRREHIVDVINIGREYSYRSRGYQGQARLPFHTDGTKGEAKPVHYAALLCRELAKKGGLSMLASASALYEAVAKRHPELLPTLTRGLHHHRQGDHQVDHSPISLRPIPVFSFHNQHLRCRYNRNNMEWAEQVGVRLTDKERGALATVDDILSEEGFALPMDLRKGDVQIINNFTVLHARSEYEDTSQQRRHLLRLWLTTENSPRGGMDLVDRFSAADSRF